MERHRDSFGNSDAPTEDSETPSQSFGDDWVHEVIAMTRPGAEIQFPFRAINEREMPFVYDDFC